MEKEKTLEEVKAELKKHLDTIVHISLHAQESFKLVKILARKESDKDLRFLKNNTFFRHTAIAHWRMTVIELTKLVHSSPMQQFNLYILMKKLATDYKALGIKRETTKKWHSILKSERVAIENLVLQRNAVYAHTDPDHEGIPNLVTIGKMDDLIKFLQDLIDQVYIEAFGYSYRIDDLIGTPSRELERVLDLALKGQKEVLEGYRSIAKEYGLETELPAKP